MYFFEISAKTDPTKTQVTYTDVRGNP